MDADSQLANDKTLVPTWRPQDVQGYRDYLKEQFSHGNFVRVLWLMCGEYQPEEFGARYGKLRVLALRAKGVEDISLEVAAVLDWYYRDTDSTRRGDNFIPIYVNARGLVGALTERLGMRYHDLQSISEFL